MGNKMKDEPIGPMWLNTILCQFNDTTLLNVIFEYAESINCGVMEGLKGMPDILAIPAFILIVDRNEVGKENWELYLEEMLFTESDIPCIVVDASTDFASPRYPNIHYLPLKTESSMDLIIHAIKDAYNRAHSSVDIGHED